MSEVFVNGDVVLDAFTPEEQAGHLDAPKLELTIREHNQHLPIMWEDYLDAPEGTVEERSLGLNLAYFYLMRNAQRLHDPTSSDLLWAERFNQATQEIYGSIDRKKAVAVAQEDIEEIQRGAPDSFAARVYQDLVMRDKKIEAAEAETSLEPLKDAAFSALRPIVEVIETLPEGPYSPAEVRSVFEKIVQTYALDSAEWSEWVITNTPGKTMLSVMAKKRQIEVPDGRAPVETKSQLLGLAMHEIGIHAMRGVNGYQAGDSLLALGLPQYSDFEEGLGVLFEYLATGSIPDKLKDRYIDIALASGSVNGITLSRSELMALGIGREQARAVARKQPAPDPTATVKAVTSHVNRIFRGGRGEPILGQDGKIQNQAVFGKDLIYYESFVRALDFVEEQLALGVAPEKLVTYLLSGKFNATDQSHVEYLAQKHRINL